ncbi:MBL fold metallo-hydrolase [Methanosphaera cuniculi]|uniref:MBL fold metallo-hydrolase n=1 Tax=Methanosphaera cuniculi TaxID=1077256 RepID=UPI0026DAA56A|nr:MBL fold metallo-hydrolase [Methanosphaera cuniculi]
MNITQHQSKKIQKNSWNNIFDNQRSKIRYIKCITSGYVKLNYSGCINEKFFDENNFINKSFYKPVVSHLLFHEDYGYLLIDAGLDETFTYNPYGSQKGIKLKQVGSKFKQNPNTTVLNYIQDHDIKLSGIFLTHLHIDHIAGLLNLDDNIPIYFSSLEKSMDVKPYYYGEYLKNKKTIKILNLDNFTKMPHLGLCMDIFNDNSLFAIHTPGHTPGHLSYLINSDEKILIAGDVFYINESVKYEVAPSDYMNNITIAQKSLEKILNFRKKYNTKIIAGHENIMI